MTDEKKFIGEEAFRSPVFQKLSEMAQKQCGMNLTVVFPKEEGWGQVKPHVSGPESDFCKLIKSSKDGARRCRMCHILLAVASCNDGVTDQKCHAGATILAESIDSTSDDGVAVLSSCVFKTGEKEEAWKNIRQRAVELGLDAEDFRRKFDQLPELNDQKIEMLREIMGIAIEMIREVKVRAALESELENRRALNRPESVGDILERGFAGEKIDEEEGRELPPVNGNLPALIRTVCELVDKRPQMPYTVEEIATAARMTPNYFSSLFHQHTGQCFMDYLTDKRIALSQQLLQNLSLNVSEVATRCGYDDPGYFTRRFKKKTGLTPRLWREKFRSGQL